MVKRKNENLEFYFKEANQERNEEVDIEIFELYFCTFTNMEYYEIEEQQELGVAPVQNKTNLDIKMNSRKYYYHRCSIIN